jgi:hypothetical protein
VSLAPGWYDAGVPGRQRWWDGTQWTEHEADVWSTSDMLAPLQTFRGRAMGWYPTPSGLLRWWDGSKWTGMRVRNGVPGADWAVAEQPARAWALAAVFGSLAIVRFFLSLLSPGPDFAGGSALLVAGWWLVVAMRTNLVLRTPTPTSAPSVLDTVQPLPGSVEAAGAGWYAVAPRVSRWWTGSRWSQYVGTAVGVRPTFHGTRTWRILQIVMWATFGLGAMSLVFGVISSLFGSGPLDVAVIVTGGLMVFAGIIFVAAAVVMLVLSGRQRRTLIPPAEPPSGHPLG